MKWFKHMTDSSAGETLTLIHEKFGASGVAMWWYLLEQVARRMTGDNPAPKASLSMKKCCLFFGCKKNKLRTFVEHLQNETQIICKCNGNIIEIEIPKLLEIKDNHLRNLQVISKSLASIEVEEEVEVEEDKEEDSLEPVEPAPKPSPVLLTFPTHGKEKLWDFTEEQATYLREAFPALDVLAEARKALGWCRTHTAQQKTANGMPKFLFSWCGREQDKSKGGGSTYANAKDEAALRHARVGQWTPPDPRDGGEG